MPKQIEMIAFSNGDSNLSSTWSNVPYFLLKTLEEKGVVVRRVNVKLEDKNKVIRFLAKACKFLLVRLGKIGMPRRILLTSHEYTDTYDYFVERKMERAVAQYPSADVLFVFGFLHLCKRAPHQKAVLFSDWTMEYEITLHQKRTPLWLERHYMKKQEKAMTEADAIVTLFPNVYDELVEKYGDKVFYLGTMINSDKADLPNLAQKHFASNRILFIGRNYYKSGAKSLIEAIRLYNKTAETPLCLDIIGMTFEHVLASDPFITYHGYLNKSNDVQKQKYYDLMANARCVCNTTERWVGASSIMEALHWKCPVIINPNEDIYKTFGEEIDFGFYCPTNEVADVHRYLCELMTMDETGYCQCSEAAADAVKDCTLDAYTDRLLAVIAPQNKHAPV